MPRYRIITLIDITRTNVSKNYPDEFKVRQQNNFNSIRQAIELRSNVEWHKDPEIHTGRLPEPADGKSKYWIWDFDIEREQIFLDNKGNPVGLLLQDLHNVPIIPDLSNDVCIDPAAVQTKGDNVNTWALEI